MKFLCSIMAVIAAFAACALTAKAQSLGAGRAPIAFEPTAPISLSPQDKIVVEGVIDGASATIVLRIDDQQNANYNNRMNDERTLQSGPFRIVIPANALKTSGGRKLNLKTLYRLIFFATSSNANVQVSNFSIRRTRPKSTNNETINLGTGATPISYRPRTVFGGQDKEFIIEGTNSAKTTQTLLLRVDDHQSDSYSNRANIERQLPPGPFRLRVPLGGLITPQKRYLEIDALRLAILTPWPETSDIHISRFDLAPIRTLPVGAIGFSFGEKNAPLPSGFKRIAPGDPRIKGNNISTRRRPNPDPLVANGLRGVSEISLIVSPGRKRVTIWSEDPGEWEYIPQALRRTIHVNNKVLLSDNLKPSEWFAKNYMSARWREHNGEMDAWTAYGQHRGNAKSILIDAKNRVTIKLAGDKLDDRFISAVLIEPADSQAALKQVNNDRAEWYRTNWRKAPNLTSAYQAETANAGRVFSYDLNPTTAHAALPPAIGAVAPGTGIRLTLSITTRDPASNTKITLSSPRSLKAKRALDTRAWAGQWRLDRTSVNSTQLSLRDDRLISKLNRLPLSPDRPRRYELWVTAPDAAEPGSYNGSFNIEFDEKQHVVPLQIEVLDIRLPPARKPAGFYLSYAPHLLWFDTPLNAAKQAACDMRFLSDLNLRGTAPPIAVPYNGATKLFEAEMMAAKSAGLAPGWLAYNPIHHFRLRHGIDRAARFAAGANQALTNRGIRPPVWSAADEPSNPDQSNLKLKQWVRALRTHGGPTIKLAGHLNTKADSEFVSLFDVLIVNQGFGIDRDRIASLSNGTQQIWFYNTFRPRLTAGIWLHNSAAERYVQWHARLPTANPLDPIDGREGDVQMFYPDVEICAERPDINRRLLRLAEGVVDQRWLIWLTNQKTDTARRLYKQLAREIPNRWSDASNWSASDLNAIRQRILQLVPSRE